MVKSSAFDEAAKKTGQSFGKKMFGFAKKHPLMTAATSGALLSAGALTALSHIIDSANKVRGLHQIVTEHNKSKAMQRQENLLRKIYEVSATKAAPVSSKPERSNIIIPPLR